MEVRRNGAEVFDAWLEAQATLSGLKADSAAPYRAVWVAWLKSLHPAGASAEDACKSTAWSTATPAQLARFVGPQEGQRSGHNRERQRSKVTQMRYFSLLDRIYAYAVMREWLSAHQNPTLGLQSSDIPKEAAQEGQVLPTKLWEKLPECFPAGDEMVDVRDRAVLTLLYELALAPEEVRNLRLADLGFDGSRLDGNPPTILSVVGKRAQQSRPLQLKDGARSALQAWLVARADHCARAHVEIDWLFFSRRSRQLTIPALFTLVSAVVLRAGQDPSILGRHGSPMRVGPQVLRNTAIREMYLRGESKEHLVVYLGLKDERALGRLRLPVRHM